ncbi:hypothetical protein GCM10027040_34090 [Halomonas shantousis]
MAQDIFRPSRQGSSPEPGTNIMALVGFGLSVVGLFFAPAALGGVVCGHLARRQIRERGEQGDTWALAALILGYLLILLSIAGLLIFGGFMVAMFGIAAFM